MLKPVQLGPSGLLVSQLCLGTMNFGIPGQGHQGDWTLDLDESRKIFRAAIDNGLYYFDCADFYGTGGDRQRTEGLYKGEDIDYLEELYRPLDNLLSLGMS